MSGMKTTIGAYDYSCPDIKAVGEAHKSWMNGKPVTQCTKVAFAGGVIPVAGKHSNGGKMDSTVANILGKMIKR